MIRGDKDLQKGGNIMKNMLNTMKLNHVLKVITSGLFGR